MAILQIGVDRLSYLLEGREDAPCLVLAHTLGTDFDMWAPQMPSFLEHFRVLRYDARGHGQSSVPPGLYSIEQMGADVLALMDHLHMQRAHFCGMSMGGLTGMWLAANHPDRIDRLVLCNTAVRLGTVELWNARIAAVNKEGMAAIAPTVIDQWFTRDFQARVGKRVDLVRSTLLHTSGAGYVASCAAVRDADLRESLSRIKTPTLVIAGMRDKATTPQEGKVIAVRIAGASYTELKAAHLPNWELPQYFAGKVIAFLT